MSTSANMDPSPNTPATNEQIFRLLFENHPIPMWIYDLETLAFLVVNRAAVQQYGYTQDEFLSLTLKEIRPLEDVPSLLENLARQRSPWQQSGNWRHRLRNGTVIDVEITSHTIDYRGHKAALVMATNISERKEMERRLNESLERLSKIFHASPAAFIAERLDDGMIVDVNESFLQLLEYQRDEIIGRRSLELNIFAQPEDRVQLVEILRTKGRVQNYEMAVQKKSGELRQVMFSIELITLDGVPHSLATAIDITKRKRAEEQLRYQANLLAHVSDAIISTDLQFNIKSWNQAAETIYGWSAAEVMGRNIGEVAAPEYLNAQAKDVLAQFRQEGQWQGEVIQQTKDGSKRYIFSSVVVLRDEAGNTTGAVAVNRDITERKRNEEQLRLQSAALESSANAIVITNHEGLIQWVNPAFTQLTGYIRLEVIGKNMRELIKSGEQNKAFYQQMWKTILAGQVWRGELVNRRKDGSHYMEEQTITPLLNAAGEITHFIAIQQDITNRKQLEAENELLAKQFYQAQKMESIGRLAGGIAHDFNNLITVIQMYSDLLKKEMSEEDPLLRRVQQIRLASERAANLTRQILAFSRQQVLEMKMLDLNVVINDLEPMLRRLIQEDISLKTELLPNLPSLIADKGQLEQILLNLVVNARDAMPNGGTITIETHQTILDEAYTREHAGVKEGVHILLAVNDTGYGMDAATQQRIFEPFFTTKPPGQGTGLGLATVFGIVKQHGGNIWVYSEIGVGTTFKIYLPVSEELSIMVEPQPLEIGLLEGSETILLVEDEDSLRQLMEDTLQAYGYHVLVAGEPEKAIALAATYDKTIHLLLTDVILPEMNGRQLYERLVSSRVELKVLYMSGYTHNIISYHDIVSEGINFLQKPFTIDGLLRKIRRVLGNPIIDS